MYEEGTADTEHKDNMIILFDNIQVIETSLLKKIIAQLNGNNTGGFNLLGNGTNAKIKSTPINVGNLLYRKNIE